MKQNDFWVFERKEKLMLLLIIVVLTSSFTWSFMMKEPSNKLLVGLNDSLSGANNTFRQKAKVHIESREGFGERAYIRSNVSKLELNSADSAQLESLPFIGEKLASRIIHYRNRLGGFYRVEQLKEVYGLRDSAYLIVQKRVMVDSTKVRKLNINVASLVELGSHPYLGYKNAKLILKYRKEHERIHNQEEFKQIVGLKFESKGNYMIYLSFE